MYNQESKYKKINYCINCNKNGHVRKRCDMPIISNGIISFYIKNFNNCKKKELEDYICININKKKIMDDIELVNINEDIQFVMIQRKHSLGYVEFIRGRYNENNLNDYFDKNALPSINYLIEQMNEEEINNIITKNFDELWDKLWGSDNKKNNKYHNEYILSKNKFDSVKINYIVLDFLKSKYCFNEWGFPKGRRNQYETDLACALREFEEETNITKNNIYVLEECEFIRETMIGTNNRPYIHNYFLALLKDDIIDKKYNNEVGDIGLMNIGECLNIIRPYHNEKIKIIKFIYSMIDDYLKNIKKLENI